MMSDSNNYSYSFNVNQYNNLDNEFNELIEKYFCYKDHSIMTKYIYYGYDNGDFTGLKPEDSAFVIYGPNIGWKIVKRTNELFTIFNLDDDKKREFMNELNDLIDKHEIYYNNCEAKPVLYLGRKFSVFESLFN